MSLIRTRVTKQNRKEFLPKEVASVFVCVKDTPSKKHCS